ncbi:PQQ-dependent sugar dehydrogenase [Candidatus Pelagibacter sp. HIMB1593]|uniref:PQQ-dependent sugar dehydrogenase n=1 Tax=Candidatus Pelagibacter sp. HIMB1593 TaxID=3413355 RepID=UPI003F862FD4
MKKIFIIFLFIIIIFLITASYLNGTKYYDRIFKVTDSFFPQMISSTLRMITNNKINSKRIKNDYNKLFLPDTQYAEINFTKIPLDFVKKSEIGFKKKSFYIDFFEEYLIIMPKNGTFYYKSLNSLLDEDKNFNKIKSNINETNPLELLDLFIDGNSIYISYVKEVNDCKHLYLAKSKIDLNQLIFNDIFSITDECMAYIQAGRIQKIEKENTSHILLSTSSYSKNAPSQSDNKPQSNNSLYGKIISIDDANKTYKIYSKGHGNILGLLSLENIILATENGPYGGDEINLIEENGNFGWDIASYGKKYSRGVTDYEVYQDEGEYKDHSEYGFNQPIFSFIPSIGISEIVKIDNNFDKDWKNNFLIATLYHKHLLRIKLNNKYSKLYYYEEIYIGERIRDLKYDIKSSTIIMALEDSGSIGLLTNLNKKE